MFGEKGRVIFRNSETRTLRAQGGHWGPWLTFDLELSLLPTGKAQREAVPLASRAGLEPVCGPIPVSSPATHLSSPSACLASVSNPFLWTSNHLPTAHHPPTHQPSCHQCATHVLSSHHLCSITSDVEDTPWTTHETPPTPTCQLNVP